MKMCVPASCIFLLVALTGRGNAHPETEAALAEVSNEILKEPRRLDLYLKRASLFEEHEVWARAIEDYQKALDIQPGDQMAQLRKGLATLRAEQYAEGEVLLKSYCKLFHADPKGHEGLGRALFKQGKLEPAVDCYREAIKISPTPYVDHYTGLAACLAARGGAFVDEAIKVLDEGGAKCGAGFTFVIAGVEHLEAAGRYREAVARLDALIRTLKFPETWLERRGKLLEKAGEPVAAAVTYKKALALLESASPVQSSRPANVALKARLKAALSSLPAKD
jgi:tetratricopeptide (TPR) repeat protein